MVTVDGGILVQEEDTKLLDEVKVVTEKAPTDEEMRDMIFGMKVVKYVKSNAIVTVKDRLLLVLAVDKLIEFGQHKMHLEEVKGQLY